MMPIIMSLAAASGLQSSRFLMPLAFAGSLGGMLTLIGTPPNALVMKAGGYTFMDYVKVGLPLQIIIGVVMTFVLPLLFPY